MMELGTRKSKGKGQHEMDVEDGWMRGWAGGASYPIEEIGLECCERGGVEIHCWSGAGASVIGARKERNGCINEVWCECFLRRGC
jgi:hypothetical protein